MQSFYSSYQSTYAGFLTQLAFFNLKISPLSTYLSSFLVVFSNYSFTVSLSLASFPQTSPYNFMYQGLVISFSSLSLSPPRRSKNSATPKALTINYTAVTPRAFYFAPTFFHFSTLACSSVYLSDSLCGHLIVFSKRKHFLEA